MRTIQPLRFVLLAAALIAVSGRAAITTIVGGPAVTDDLSTPSGITAVGDSWPSSTGLTQMKSSVQQVNANTWFYQYEWITAAPGAKNLSHFLIEITPGAQLSEFFNFSTQPSDGVFTYTSTSQGSSEVGLPGSMTGFKFSPTGNTTDFIVSFDSHHAPTYGDFYAQDGKSGGAVVYAYNAGFTGNAVEGDSLDPNTHIIVPDGLVLAVPEANFATASELLLVPLAGVSLFRKRLSS